MMVRGEAYMRTPKITQKIPTKLDLEAWLWNTISVTTAITAMKAHSTQSQPITFNCIQINNTSIINHLKVSITNLG